MKEELINNILEKIKKEEVKREELEVLDEVVLKRLCLINSVYNLENILWLIFNYNLDTNLIMYSINILELNLLYKTEISQILDVNITLKLKEEALLKISEAKYDFQAECIKEIYCNDNVGNIKYRNLIVEFVLECSKEFQTDAIYDIYSHIEEMDNDSVLEYLELAKLIAREKNEYKVNIYSRLDWILEILDLGLLLTMAEMISKTKNKVQASYMFQYFEILNKENAPYVLKYSEYFLKTTSEDKLQHISTYISYCLTHNLNVEEEKINLIINTPSKIKTSSITDLLTSFRIKDNDLVEESLDILKSSKHNYNIMYATTLAKLDNFDGAMIVNEAENKYKAEKVFDTLVNFDNEEKIDNSCEFAALINSVYSKVEIDLIYLLSKNIYLNELNIALPMARIIANATECEEDMTLISECLKISENSEKVFKGLLKLIQDVKPKYRAKVQKIITNIMLNINLNPNEIFSLSREKNK